MKYTPELDTNLVNIANRMDKHWKNGSRAFRVDFDIEATAHVLNEVGFDATWCGNMLIVKWDNSMTPDWHPLFEKMWALEGAV